MEYTGTISHIGATEQISAKFKKRLLVLTDSAPKYPQQIPFIFSQDNVDALNGYKVGDSVTVAFSLRGREWNGKYFGENSAFKIKLGEQQQDMSATTYDETLPF